PAGALHPKSDTRGYYVVTALGPDLMENARNAVRDTIGWLTKEKHLSREDAYVLCSLAGDLRISQTVDQPNRGVSFSLALSGYSAAREIPDRGGTWPGRDGRRLPLDAPTPRDPGGHQGPGRAVLERPELSPALPPRGGDSGRAQPPGHRARVRLRRGRSCAVHRHGVGRGTIHAVVA